MAYADEVRTAIDDVSALPEVSARTLYNAIMAALVHAHQFGLPHITYRLPTGYERTISVDSATKTLESLRGLIAAESGGIISQTAEMR